MLQTSSQFNDAIKAYGRSFTTSFFVNGTQVPSQYILNATIVETGASEGALKVGEFCRNSINFRASTLAGNIFSVGARVSVTISVEGADDVIPLGVFYINECKKNSMYEYDVTGYDLAQEWSDTFAIESSNVQSIISSIETLTGQHLVNKSLLTTTTVESIPENTNYITWLSYIAMLDGYSIRSNRLGDLELYKYNNGFIDFVTPSKPILTTFDSLPPGQPLLPSYPLYDDTLPEQTTYDIEIDTIFDGGLVADDEETKIESYTCYGSDSILKVGSGYGITVSNPYVKSLSQLAKMAKYIWTSFYAFTVRYRGNPALQIGDRVNVPKNFEEVTPSVFGFVMKQTFTLDGGFSATVECYSDRARKDIIPVTPTMQRIEATERETRNIREAIMNSIIDGGSGYYSVIDAEGNVVDLDNKNKPAGWQVTDSEVITETTKGWRWILGGLYHSSDGFQTFDRLAITADGKIYADEITAETIAGKTFTGSKYMFELTSEGGNIRLPSELNTRSWMNGNNRIILDGASFDGGGFIASVSDLFLNPLQRFGLYFGASITPDVTIDGSNCQWSATLNQYGYADTMYIDGNVEVSGTKSRVVATEDYGTRTLYCYETASPTFGDIGESTIGEDGMSYIFFDPKFAQTIDTYQYQVFLQRYGEGDAIVIDRNPSYFVIKGTPGLSVGWEVKAKQVEFKQLRLEKITERTDVHGLDYGDLAQKHLKEIKEEREK